MREWFAYTSSWSQHEKSSTGGPWSPFFSTEHRCGPCLIITPSGHAMFARLHALIQHGESCFSWYIVIHGMLFLQRGAPCVCARLKGPGLVPLGSWPSISAYGLENLVLGAGQPVWGVLQQGSSVPPVDLNSRHQHHQQHHDRHQWHIGMYINW